MISVCMATYNGEKFIEEQLDSILMQLESEDELIISDDGSTDTTLLLLTKYVHKDRRIKLIKGPQKGLIANFENAIKNSHGEVIFLADQDDVWLPEKVYTIKEFFDNHADIDVVVADLVVVDEQLKPIISSYFKHRHVKRGFLRNIIRNSYIGAGMAFRSKVKKQILPLPPTIPMHDMWIALISEWHHRVAFIDKPLTLYRRHGENASEIKTKASLLQQFKWRFSLLASLLKRIVLKK